MIDLPPLPKLWLPTKPAIIRAASMKEIEATFPFPFFVKSRAARSVSFTANAIQDTVLTTFTFASQAIGTAFTGRRVVVGVGAISAASRTISSVTIGGIAATPIAFVEGASGGVFVPGGLYIAQVDTGTTASVVVTYSGSANRCGIGVFVLSNMTTSVASDFGTSIANPETKTLAVPVGGVAIGYATVYQSGGTPTFGWSGITERFDQVLETSVSSGSHSGACDNLPAGGNVVCTATPTGFTAAAGVFATW